MQLGTLLCVVTLHKYLTTTLVGLPPTAYRLPTATPQSAAATLPDIVASNRERKGETEKRNAASATSHLSNLECSYWCSSLEWEELKAKGAWQVKNIIYGTPNKWGNICLPGPCGTCPAQQHV